MPTSGIPVSFESRIAYDARNRPVTVVHRAKRQANARVFGQDLMRGEHIVGGRTSLPAGVTFGEIENFDGADRTITGTSIFSS